MSFRKFSLTMPSTPVILSVAFAATAAYSVYAYFKYDKVLQSSREGTSVKPTIDRATLVAILREVETNVKTTVRAYEAGLKLPATKDEKAGMREAMPHLLRRELGDIQAAVLAKRGVSEEDLIIAQTYFSTGATRDKEVASAITSIKKAAGRHIMTKRKLVEAIIAFHEFQISIMPETVEAAMDAGPPQSPAFMSIIQGKPRVLGDEWVASEYGLASATELINMALAEGKTDKEFGDAVAEIIQEYGGKLQQAAQQVMQAVMMQRMGGGGMGM